jgi:xylulose-5-phosphate/fructose-6-phosphate phosphoketolase
MVGSKQPSPVFLSPQEAESHCRAGASVFEFASTDKGINPDVVLVGIGAELTFEVVKAAEMLKEIAPELRVRVANVTDLMVLETEGVHPHALTNQDFDSLFTSDRSVHFNYHGYATELKGLLFARPNVDRVTVEGYREEGSTTTPFDMMLVNHVSRYHVMEYALRGGAKVNEKIRVRLVPLLADIKHRIQKTREYIVTEGKDLDDTYDLNKVKGSGGGVLSEG